MFYNKTNGYLKKYNYSYEYLTLLLSDNITKETN